VIVSVQVQLLTSSSIALSTITRAFLTLGMMSELIGVMLVIYFLQFPANHNKNSNVLRIIIRGGSEAPAVFILMGIIGVAVALVVEMLAVSVGTAITMASVLILGVVFCFVAWW
jgi:hypothetical protein